MAKRDWDRTLALAGLFQAAHLVQRLARNGQVDTEAFVTCTNSILKTDTETTADVYGNASGVGLGLKLLRDKLSGRSDHADLEIARYVVSSIQLAGKIKKQQKLLDAIQDGLKTIKSQMQFFNGEQTRNSVHPNLIAKLAELYLKTISTLKPRIMVSGEQGYLANPGTTQKVRVALFAGIRSAFLWKQLGGSRWQLLFGRSRIVADASNILNELQQQTSA